jgi:sigma-B regulation protein RsbU (phosphoserine phosphatase)
MTEIGSLLEAFFRATGCEAAVWEQAGRNGAVALKASAPSPVTPPTPWSLREDGSTAREDTSVGPRLIVFVPGSKRAWLTVGPCLANAPPLDRYVDLLLPIVSQHLQGSTEIEHAANELAERYEEINLLYTISEILGRTVELDEAATTILHEISETVGARRGAILVHDRVTDTLQVVAGLGVAPEDVPPIAITDERSVSACVFRSRQAEIAEGDDTECPAEVPYRRGPMLSVPIIWTTPGGGEPLGVVNLSDRRAGHPFTAGDQKLVAAIATQIGTTIQNTRLVRASLNQQRLVQEMRLAHDLQMRLLPKVSVVAGDATVAARVMPADSVGGDFYNLFRLADGCTGAMIGDVSGHGYRAALIMALTMSASAIHAQSMKDPAQMLDALRASLKEELTTTEMFISAFYGVIDRRNGLLRYANTGLPHAFVVAANGGIDRLDALDPPIGMVEIAPHAATRSWHPGRDLLVLFTDGVSDARNRVETRLGEEVVLDLVVQHRAETPEAILDRVLGAITQHVGDTPLRDDITLVLLRG